MKLLFDVFPLVLFFGAYKYYDIYIATAVAIAACIVQVAVFWYQNKRFETMHLVTLGVIVVFGGLTLVLRDDSFIKWKPTIVNWIFAVIIVGSQFVGRRTALEVLLGSTLKLPKAVWRGVNLSWGVFFLIVGFLNVYVAFYFRPELSEQVRTDFWVNFKVFGLMGLTFMFVMTQIPLIQRYHISEGDDTSSGDPAD